MTTPHTALPPLIRALKVIGNTPPFQNTPAGEKLHEEIIRLRDILHSAQPLVWVNNEAHVPVSDETFEAASVVLSRWLMEHPEMHNLVLEKRVANGAKEAVVSAGLTEAQTSAPKPDPWAHVRRAHEVHGMKVEYTDPKDDDHPWKPCPNPGWYPNREYRLDPSQPCPESYLRELCGGMEPHRLDWTVEMLEGGWRPLCKKELFMAGDEAWLYRSLPENKSPYWEPFSMNQAESQIPGSPETHTRTRRPAPLPQPGGDTTFLPGKFTVQTAPPPEPSQEKWARERAAFERGEPLEWRHKPSGPTWYPYGGPIEGDDPFKEDCYEFRIKPTPPVAGSAKTATVDDMRSLGWMVAVHNDYRQDGQGHTFWLFTKNDRFVKGEAETDDEAIAMCMEAAIAFAQKAPEGVEVPDFEKWFEKVCETWVWTHATTHACKMAWDACVAAYSALLAQKDGEIADYKKHWTEANTACQQSAQKCHEEWKRAEAAESRAEVTGKELEERLKQSQRYYDELVEAQRQRNQFKNQFEEYKRLSDQLTGEVDSLREKLATAERESLQTQKAHKNYTSELEMKNFGLEAENADLKKQLAASGSGSLLTVLNNRFRRGFLAEVRYLLPDLERHQCSEYKCALSQSETGRSWSACLCPTHKAQQLLKAIHDACAPLPPSPVKEGGQ